MTTSSYGSYGTLSYGGATYVGQTGELTITGVSLLAARGIAAVHEKVEMLGTATMTVDLRNIIGRISRVHRVETTRVVRRLSSVKISSRQQQQSTVTKRSPKTEILSRPETITWERREDG